MVACKLNSSVGGPSKSLEGKLFLPGRKFYQTGRRGPKLCYTQGMTYVADLHIHSRYAYATSKQLSLENLAAWANLKGIDLLASADFTHPAWFRELQEKLVAVAPGLYQYRGVKFVLGTELSCVYRQGGRQRRVHILLFAPDLDTVASINSALADHGKLDQDGRPTLRLSARDLTALAMEINRECLIIPAHVWTPWYGLFGSKSGFDQLEECFLDLSSQVHAIETGLSSDPAMNWRVPQLGDRTIVSFSDAHSLPKLGREATAFEGPLGYQGLAEALAANRVAYTVEYYPEEGKYHYDGHRKCGVCQSPWVTGRQGSLCPVCGRPLTLGVLNRTRLLSQCETNRTGKIFELDSPSTSESSHQPPDGQPGVDGFVRSDQGRPPFIRLLPLQEIIGATQGLGPNTKGVQQEYRRLVSEFGSELNLLIRAEAADLVPVAGEGLARAILEARRGDIRVAPGYDGVYGKVSLKSTETDSSGEAARGGRRRFFLEADN